MGRRPNAHKSEKRRKELDRLKKQEEKRQKRLNKASGVAEQTENAEQQGETTVPVETTETGTTEA